MKTFLLSAVTVVVAATLARADNVTLTTNAPAGTPLTVNPGVVSGPMLFRVENTAPLTSSMRAWQMNLMIVPIGTTTGTVTFNSPTTQIFTPPNGQPPSYLLNGNSVGISVANNGSNLQANDFVTGAAVAIPVGPSNLLQVDFLASPTAGGTFGVFAVQGAGNTLFSNGASADQFFTNVPLGTGTVQIGEIFVPVPEPTGLFAATIVVGFLGSRLRRRLRRG